MIPHNTERATPVPEGPVTPGRQNRGKRKRLTAAELKALSADPARVRRVIPPAGPQRVEGVGVPKRRPPFGRKAYPADRQG